MVCSPPGSSVHGISQARTLEWVAFSFFRGSSSSEDRTWCSSICRQILYHWAAREAQNESYLDVSYLEVILTYGLPRRLSYFIYIYISLPMQDSEETRVWAWVGKISWRRKRQPTSVFLPGKFHGQKSLVSYIAMGCKRSHTTKHACT